MVGSPRPFAALGLGFNPTAIPVFATIDGPMLNVEVGFDPDILNEPAIDTANWLVRWNNINRVVNTADITGSSVNLAVVAGGADPGIDRVAYAPPPFDVITSAGGNPVQAFTDFPLTL